MADHAGLGVAVDVGLPLPARRVRVACADVLGLEALELLLRAQLVGLRGGGGVLVWLITACHHVSVRGVWKRTILDS